MSLNSVVFMFPSYYLFDLMFSFLFLDTMWANTLALMDKEMADAIPKREIDGLFFK